MSRYVLETGRHKQMCDLYPGQPGCGNILQKSCLEPNRQQGT